MNEEDEENESEHFTSARQLLNDDRRRLLARVEDWLETPMLVLGEGLRA